HDLQRPRELNEGVAVGLRLERVGGRVDLKSGGLAQLGAHLRGELGVGVQARAGGRAAERDLPDVLQRGGNPLPPQADLGGRATAPPRRARARLTRGSSQRLSWSRLPRARGPLSAPWSPSAPEIYPDDSPARSPRANSGARVSIPFSSACTRRSSS